MLRAARPNRFSGLQWLSARPAACASQFFAALHGMESRSLIDTAMVERVRKVAGEAMFDYINFMLLGAGV